MSLNKIRLKLAQAAQDNHKKDHRAAERARQRCGKAQQARKHRKG